MRIQYCDVNNFKYVKPLTHVHDYNNIEALSRESFRYVCISYSKNSNIVLS